MKAEISKVEKEFREPFKYPKLYKPTNVIHVLCESSLAIITQEDKNNIKYSIWGLLPHNSNEDCSIIQRIRNTLTIHKNEVVSNKSYEDFFLNRRCLIVVTGFIHII